MSVWIKYTEPHSAATVSRRNCVYLHCFTPCCTYSAQLSYTLRMYLTETFSMSTLSWQWSTKISLFIIYYFWALDETPKTSSWRIMYHHHITVYFKDTPVRVPLYGRLEQSSAAFCLTTSGMTDKLSLLKWCLESRFSKTLNVVSFA